MYIYIYIYMYIYVYHPLMSYKLPRGLVLKIVNQNWGGNLCKICVMGDKMSRLLSTHFYIPATLALFLSLTNTLSLSFSLFSPPPHTHTKTYRLNT